MVKICPEIINFSGFFVQKKYNITQKKNLLKFTLKVKICPVT